MKPKLVPLQQWVCDTCGDVIQKPKDGYIQFKYDISNGCHKCSDIIIVHHITASPLKEQNRNGCYVYNADLDLESFLGAQGIARLLSKIDVGVYHDPNYSGPEMVNLRKWTEVFRRLYIPYYEEARLYWEKARCDGFFDGANEIWPYLPENLQLLIEEYGS